MKKIKDYTLLLSLLPCLFYSQALAIKIKPINVKLNHKDSNQQSSQIKNPTDATEELNQIAQQPKPHNQNNDETSTTVVLSHFANMVQNFIQIVQNPHNPVNVGTNIAQMFAGIINVALEAIKKSPTGSTSDETKKYIEQLETAFRVKLSSLKNCAA